MYTVTYVVPLTGGGTTVIFRGNKAAVDRVVLILNELGHSWRVWKPDGSLDTTWGLPPTPGPLLPHFEAFEAMQHNQRRHR